MTGYEKMGGIVIPPEWAQGKAGCEPAWEVKSVVVTNTQETLATRRAVDQLPLTDELRA
jgi:hypothetical protein